MKGDSEKKWKRPRKKRPMKKKKKKEYKKLKLNVDILSGLERTNGRCYKEKPRDSTNKGMQKKRYQEKKCEN